MNKIDLRASVASDLSSFFAAGGSVTVIKSKNVRRQNIASGRQKIHMGWSEPKNRPSNAWDLVDFT